MPDGDKNFRGSLVFDIRKLLRHQKTIYIAKIKRTQRLLYAIIHLVTNEEHKTEPSAPKDDCKFVQNEQEPSITININSVLTKDT